MIFINDTDEPYVALGIEGDSDVVIPAVCVRRSDGESICKRIGQQKHVCTASLSFGDSSAVSDELESFLGGAAPAPAPAPAPAQSAKNTARSVAEAMRSAGEAARDGFKELQTGGQGASPPRSSAAIVGELLTKRKGQGGQGLGKGLPMGLQTVDDSIYNEPAPAPTPTPAPAPSGPVARPVAPQSPAGGETQQTLMRLLQKQKPPATTSDSVPETAPADPPTTPQGGQLADAEAGAMAAEAKLRQLQMAFEHERQELRASASQELARVTEAAQRDIAEANRRAEEHQAAQVKGAAALRAEEEAHGATRQQLASSTDAHSESKLAQNSAEQRLGALESDLQQARSEIAEQAARNAGEDSQSSSAAEEQAAAVAQAVEEARRTADTKLESMQRGFQYDLEELEKQIAQHKGEQASHADELAAAVSQAVAEAERASETHLESLQRTFRGELDESRSEMRVELEQAEQRLADATVALDEARDKASSASSSPARTAARVCADCGEVRQRDEYSGTQWKRGDGLSRCSSCVAAAVTPSKAPAEDERGASVAAAKVERAVAEAHRAADAKLEQQRKAFECDIAEMQTQAARAADEAEQRLVATRDELAATSQAHSAAMEQVRLSMQQKVDETEHKASADAQEAERKLADMQLAIERARTKFVAERTNSENTEQARLQEALDEAHRAAEAKLESVRQAHQCDLDEAQAASAEAVRDLRAELTEARGKSSSGDAELGELGKTLADTKLAAAEAARAAEAKLQSVLRDFQCDQEEAEHAAAEKLAEAVEAVELRARSSLDEATEKLQNQLNAANDRCDELASARSDAEREKAAAESSVLALRTELTEASTSAAESSEASNELQQAATRFQEERAQWTSQQDALNKRLERVTAQYDEVSKQFKDSEQLVTEMSSELERVQLESLNKDPEADARALLSEHEAASDARLQQARKAFQCDLEDAEAACAARLEEAAEEAGKELAQAKADAQNVLDDAVKAHADTRTQLEAAVEVQTQLRQEAERSQGKMAELTTQLGKAETELSERGVEHHRAQQQAQEAAQQAANLRSDLERVTADMHAQREAAKTNEAVQEKVSDEMALALEKAHLAADSKVQQAQADFNAQLEATEAAAAERESRASEEARVKLAQVSAQADTAEAALRSLEEEHASAREKLVKNLDAQDRALEFESQVEQLQADLAELKRQSSAKEAQHESEFERTRTAHAEALQTLETKLQSADAAAQQARDSAEGTSSRLRTHEQSAERLAKVEQDLQAELKEAQDRHSEASAASQLRLEQLTSELEGAQAELFSTAEEAVAAELSLTDQVEKLSASKAQGERDLAGAIAERQAALAECERLRPAAANRSSAEMQLATAEAEKAQLQASNEALSRQLRLITSEKEAMAESLRQERVQTRPQPASGQEAQHSAPDVPARQEPQKSGAASAEAEPQGGQTAVQPETQVAEETPTSTVADTPLLSTREYDVVAKLQEEMVGLRSELEKRAGDNQSLQEQIEQLQQLVHGQSPQSAARSGAPNPARKAPLTPDQAVANGARRRSSSPSGRDPEAELETLEVMVHALRQEAAAAATTSPTHSDRGIRSRARSPASVRPSGFGTRSPVSRTSPEGDLEPSGPVEDEEDELDEEGDYGDEPADAPRRLCEAVASGAWAVVKILVTDPRSANALWDRTDGATLLHAAAFNGHAHIAAHLLAHDADVDAQMVNGATPIFAAAQQGHVEVLDELLAAGATVNWVSDDGSTPLYVAVSSACVLGTIWNRALALDNSVAAQQAWKGYAGVVNRLLRAGAHADRYHRERATALFVAAQEGHAQVVRVLLAAGADAMRPWQDAHGRRWTAMDKALANKHTAVVAVLREPQRARRGTPRRSPAQAGHGAERRQSTASRRASPMGARRTPRRY